jgi:hypothetical protein
MSLLNKFKSFLEKEIKPDDQMLWDSLTTPKVPDAIKEEPTEKPIYNLTDIDMMSADNEKNLDSVFGKLIQAESGGKQFDKSGNILTSNKGAQGITQVMPKTQKDPGFGVTPAKDNSEQELLRVGKEYLNAMYNKFNNWEYAVAAYNAGPGNVEKAVTRAKKEGKDWKTFLPKRSETLPYIDKILGTGYAEELKETK